MFVGMFGLYLVQGWWRSSGVMKKVRVRNELGLEDWRS